MTKISPDAYVVLKEAYDIFKEKVGPTKLPVVLSLLKKSSNDISRILKESAIDGNYVDEDLKKELTEEGYAQTIDNTSNLSLTAKGVWTVESIEDHATIDDLISGIDNYCFNGFKKKVPIPSRNKIVAFSMVAMRSYSKESAVDVRLEKNVSEYWWNIFLEVNDFLLNVGAIPEKDSLRKGKQKSGIEDKASDLIRHSDKLPRLTDDIFSKSGNNQYWLEVLNDKGTIDTDRLSLFIKLILKDKIDEYNCDEFWKFANNLCLNHRYEIESSYDDDTYLSCEYDSDVRRAFKKSLDHQIN